MLEASTLHSGRASTTSKLQAADNLPAEDKYY